MKIIIGILQYFVLFMSALNVHAAENNLYNQTCLNPYKTICADQTQLDLKRNQNIDEVREEIQKQAELIYEKTEKKDRPSFFDFLKFSKNKGLMQQALRTASLQKIKEFEAIFLSVKNVSKIKGYFYNLIEKMNLNSSDKDLIKNQIEALDLLPYAEVLKKNPQIAEQICGADDEYKIGAMHVRAENIDGIVICPGLLFAQKDKIYNETLALSGIIAVVSHEMGHRIDNKRIGIGPYLDFYYCIKNKKIISGESMANQGHELIADQWSLLITAAFIKETANTAQNSMTLLKNGWSMLCGSIEDEFHPSAFTRINLFLTRSKLIRNAIGCSPVSESNKSCYFINEDSF
ncbi:MAG: hypothetical protein ACXVCP_15015 [Bdellovibrio sp.]